MTLVSIIVPVYNEEKTVRAILDRLQQADWGPGCAREIVVVDDGSRDATPSLLADIARAHPEWIFLRQEHNRGKGAAIKTGVRHSRGDIVVIQDADLEYDPADCRLCLQPILSGEADVVYGSRRLCPTNTTHSSFAFFLGGVTTTWLFNLLFGQSLTDLPTGYKVFRSGLLKRFDVQGDGFDWEFEVSAKLVRAGVRIREVPVSYAPRTRKEGKKIRWHDGLRALWTLVKCRIASPASPAGPP